MAVNILQQTEQHSSVDLVVSTQGTCGKADTKSIPVALGKLRQDVEQPALVKNRAGIGKRPQRSSRKQVQTLVRLPQQIVGIPREVMFVVRRFHGANQVVDMAFEVGDRLRLITIQGHGAHTFNPMQPSVTAPSQNIGSVPHPTNRQQSAIP
ncbi:hypothetical protein SAMN06264365_1323 [Actinoplanes regularis]|uniref:Uncharacterized protein n=1 Tax=Actinoplanes regularis TaxID=52697 RepID=A0A239IZV3_9ACTN|nr:hypothetical protein Are01nite_84130 [Actinoplanes regularis]SNS99147.1 hypothetical protein SAMN06264365_1323 [Actinoplanes regularis]